MKDLDVVALEQLDTTSQIELRLKLPYNIQVDRSELWSPCNFKS